MNDEHIISLSRYGLQWNGPDNFVCIEMTDGYWTPWHIAQSKLTESLRTAEYWKDEHLAGNAEIERLRASLEMIARCQKDTDLFWCQNEARKALIE